MLKIDSEFVVRRLTEGLQKEFKKRNFTHAVLGLSGGVDSAVVATLLCRALGNKNVTALVMPYADLQKQLSKDAIEFARQLEIPYFIIDIAPQIDAYFKNCTDADKIRRGNKMSRERMSILYDFARKLNALVVGTGNKSELLMGYFTLHGDGGCSLLPIGDFYKTHVWQIAQFLKVPLKIINRKPSAGFWEDQTDEGEMGIRYRDLDRLLYFMMDRQFSDEELRAQGFRKNVIDKIKSHIRAVEYKRQSPPILKVF